MAVVKQVAGTGRVKLWRPARRRSAAPVVGYRRDESDIYRCVGCGRERGDGHERGCD